MSSVKETCSNIQKSSMNEESWNDDGYNKHKTENGQRMYFNEICVWKKASVKVSYLNILLVLIINPDLVALRAPSSVLSNLTCLQALSRLLRKLNTWSPFGLPTVPWPIPKPQNSICSMLSTVAFHICCLQLHLTITFDDCIWLLVLTVASDTGFWHWQ